MESVHSCIAELAKSESLKASDWWQFFSDPDNHSFTTIVVEEPTKEKEYNGLQKPLQDKREAVRKLIDFMKRFDASQDDVTYTVRRLLAYQRLYCGCQPPGTELLGDVLDPMVLLKKQRILHVPAVKPQPSTQPPQPPVPLGPPLSLQPNGAFRPYKREERIRGNNSEAKKESLQPPYSPSDADLDRELQQLNLRHQRKRDAVDQPGFTPAKPARKRSVAKTVEVVVQTRGKRTADSEGAMPQSCSKRSSLASASPLHGPLARGLASADPRGLLDTLTPTVTREGVPIVPSRASPFNRSPLPSAHRASTSNRRGQIFRHTSTLGLTSALTSRLPSFQWQTSSQSERSPLQGQQKTQGETRGQGHIWSQGQSMTAGQGQASQVALPVCSKSPFARTQVLRFLRSSRASTPGKPRIPRVDQRKK